jgi:hypothetical protein
MLAFSCHLCLHRESQCAVLGAMVEGVGVSNAVMAVSSRNGTTSKEVTIADCSR